MYIRNNTADVNKMCDAVRATCHHVTSTDENYKHDPRDSGASINKQ